MRVRIHGAALALLLFTVASSSTVTQAQTVPQTAAEVAQPGGQIPGAPKLALVKVADGFNDPVGVTAANDGSRRLFVVERVGRVRVVRKEGTVQKEPFLDLTNFPPWAPTWPPASSSRAFGPSPSIRSSRTTATSSSTTPPCPSTAPRW